MQDLEGMFDEHESIVDNPNEEDYLNILNILGSNQIIEEEEDEEDEDDTNSDYKKI